MFDLIGSAISAVGSYMGTQATNAANAQQAQNQMDFQAQMSNTAYQRGTADMKAAGLNPMLAYSQGGATTPGGAMATMQNSLGNAVNSAGTGAQIGQALETAQHSIANTDADTKLKEATADKTRSDAVVNAAMVPYYQRKTEESVASAGSLDAAAARARALTAPEVYRTTKEGDLADYRGTYQDRLNKAGGGQLEANEMIARARDLGISAALGGLQLPRAENEARSQDSWWMRNISPYLPDVLKGVSSAATARGIAR